MKGKKQWKLAVILLFVIVCGAFYLRVQDSGGTVEFRSESQHASEEKKETDTKKSAGEDLHSAGQSSGKDENTSQETTVLQNGTSLQEEASLQEELLLKENNSQERDPVSEDLVVHICGEVVQEGVYRLPAGSRIVDAIQAAGGLTEEAAGAYLNQAGVLADGMQIYVPSQAEVTEWKASGEITSSFPNAAGNAGSSQTGTSEGTSFIKSQNSSGNQANQANASEHGKIDLNRAGREELMSLPGIGESKAEAILAYREANGGFKSIEELMEVPGIKEGVFRKIEERITIEGI